MNKLNIKGELFPNVHPELFLCSPSLLQATFTITYEFYEQSNAILSPVLVCCMNLFVESIKWTHACLVLKSATSSLRGRKLGKEGRCK